MDIEAPQHWCEESVTKLAPWAWSMQSVIMIWYYVDGRHTGDAKALRNLQGEWESEWSLRHMLQLLRHMTLNATINTNCADKAQLQEMVRTLKTWANLAA